MDSLGGFSYPMRFRRSSELTCALPPFHPLQPKVTNQVVKKLNDRISDLEMRLKNDLKCLREELVKAVQDVNNGRQEIKFDWELKPFSELSTSKVYRSSWFYVRNVPWYLFARVSEIRDGSRFLDVFLCLQNNYGCNKWSCSAKFDIRILNQSGKENIVVKNEHIFMQNEGRFPVETWSMTVCDDRSLVVIVHFVWLR